MSNPGPAITSTPLLNQESNPNPSVASSGDGYQVGQVAADLIGFWGALPIVQPALTGGNVHTGAAGAGAAVKVDTTFDGSIGTKAYTIGDLVIALKSAGIIAS